MSKFFSNWIVKNILLAILAVILLAVVADFLLARLTNHNKVIEVPDMTNMTVVEARRTAANHGLRARVADSVFVRRMQKGAVYTQNPKPGSMVKKGRRIRLTINAMNAKKVSMPNLVGYSMRQAKAALLSRGLNLGRLIYVDDIATNNVLKQLHSNRQIAPGDQVESGAEIDLVVGLNGEDRLTYVPNVVGMKMMRSVDAVHDNSLNVKKLVFDKRVKTYADSINAIVQKQTPSPSNAPVIMGTDVTLYLGPDPVSTVAKTDTTGKK
ncbi:MAG: PASTA domain-containing protein [Bacteroidales bacterium]|nr:PASTA domain-containing protein [Bacteroidales bacterium]